jgi:hypothetical protein
MSPGHELAIVQSTASTVGSLINATAAVIQHVRNGGLGRAAEYRDLQEKVIALRHIHRSEHIGSLSKINMNHLGDMYDLAEKRVNNPYAYAAALEVAEQAARLLAANLERLARELQ